MGSINFSTQEILILKKLDHIVVGNVQNEVDKSARTRQDIVGKAFISSVNETKVGTNS